VSFALYLVGFVVFISGLAWLATLVGVSQAVIMPIALLLLGVGVFTAAANGRERPST
jgi:hypothetical protein